MQNKSTVAKKAMWVVCCQTGVASNFVFWTFSYVVVIGLALNYIISSKGIKQSASFNLKY
jgi:hypothetical protein